MLENNSCTTSEEMFLFCSNNIWYEFGGTRSRDIEATISLIKNLFLKNYLQISSQHMHATLYNTVVVHTQNVLNIFKV